MFDFLMGYVMGERAAGRAAALSRAAAGSVGSTAGEFHDVNERVDRLILVVDAMWSLLKDSGWTDEQLRERLRAMDLEDGTEDGRRTPQPTPCAKCGSMVEAGRSSCVFCGGPISSPVGPTDRI